jgi:ABC-type polysaccharide/polyol phosphate export permease
MQTESAHLAPPTPAAPPPPTSLARSFAIQRRVLWALMMREVITRFGRENIGVFWLIGEPMMFTLGVAALWSAAGLAHSSQLPVVAFAITGYSSVLLWRNSVSRCSSGIAQNVNLLYHRNVRVLDVFVTRILLEMVGASASFLTLTTFFVAIEWVAPPQDPLLVVIGWLMLAWFGMAIALCVGAATAYSEIIERLWHPVSYLLFPLSGAAFMVDWLPPGGQEAVLTLPMVHGVEILRQGYFGSVVRTHYDIPYMAAISLVLTMVGLLLVRAAERRVGEK